MQYMGSKNRLAKKLLPILNYYRGNRVWVEPFVGGANMIDKVYGERIGNDCHIYLIALHKALQNGYIPPTSVSKDFYYEVKGNIDNYPDELIGFIGFLCSFGGKWWGGYAKNKKGDNYAERGSRLIVQQSKKLSNVKWQCGSYLDMYIPPLSLIYCDPPYRGTATYSNPFDHDEFWEWARCKSIEGHLVYISEYTAPEDFECLLSIETTTKLNKNLLTDRVEKLFKYKNK
jgi:DNA adenine methylase